MLEIDRLVVKYGTRTVLSRLSLRLNTGEVLAVIGPNGAGKSTLIRALSGVAPAESGAARIDNMDLLRMKPEQRARLVAVAPQAVRLPEAFTVFDTVVMGRTAYLGWFGREGETDCQIAWEAMQKTGTTSLAERRMGELSGGEQQRVMIARALAQRAPVLLLDEPTAHLDLKYQSGILQLVRGLAETEGLAVMAALHDLNLAALYAHRVALLVEGSIRAVGAPADVLTAEQLSAAYHVPVSVVAHPEYGTPLVLPDGR
jgi:iron complex transport system ATP-binding protein